MNDLELANLLYRYLSINNIRISECVFLCIGSNKVIGDSLGLVVGQKLKNNFLSYGDLINPINYLNIEEKLSLIKQKHKNPYMIVIDSAMSKSNKIGDIIISNNKIELGKALGKKGVLVGDISIRAVVAERKESYLSNYYELNKVSFFQINHLANRILNIISIICNDV